MSVFIGSNGAMSPCPHCGVGQGRPKGPRTAGLAGHKWRCKSCMRNWTTDGEGQRVSPIGLRTFLADGTRPTCPHCNGVRVRSQTPYGGSRGLKWQCLNAKCGRYFSTTPTGEAHTRVGSPWRTPKNVAGNKAPIAIPACSRPVTRPRHYWIITTGPGGMQIHRCRRCKVTYSVPLNIRDEAVT